MSFLYSKFTDSDNELSEFAHALAVPARIAIVRFISANGNSITQEEFCNIPFSPQLVNQHVLELKSLGILNAGQGAGEGAYSLNENLFDQMYSAFSTLTDSINSFRSQER